MRGFVLGTGRCGTLTIAEAFRHAENFTVGHESRFRELRLADRFDYPDDHIEVDNRLAYMVGTLDRLFPDAELGVVTRPLEATAQSFVRVSWGRRGGDWRHLSNSKVMSAIQGVMNRRIRDESERLEYARSHVAVASDNIRLLVAGRQHVVIPIEDPKLGFARLWTRLGCEGDLAAALAELDVKHHENNCKRPQWARPSKGK